MNTEYYNSMSKEALEKEKADLQAKYNSYKAQGLNLNMSRGKPGPEQLDLSLPMMDILNSSSDYSVAGDDCRNYGVVDGLPEMRQFFGNLLGVDANDVIVGGNSSLNMMFDTVNSAMYNGFGDCKPWAEQGTVKFLCPCPGYDRHFGVTEFFGIEMIVVPMTEHGPDMDIVEQLVNTDASIKGIWCVPKYSNPQGITYSDETVRRFAALKPAAKDFKIFWDNAYCVHHITDTPDQLLNLIDKCERAKEMKIYLLYSLLRPKLPLPAPVLQLWQEVKIPLANIRKRLAFQTIGPDKINQLRHLRFFKDINGVDTIMNQHKELLQPKFNIVLETMQKELAPVGVASWTSPHGGYFISVDVMEGCAKRVVALCKEAGVTLTGAGATYPYGKESKRLQYSYCSFFPICSGTSGSYEYILYCN